MTCVIREATASDVGLILSLVKELAIYEREPNAVVASEEDFLRDGFGPAPKFFVLIADVIAGKDSASPHESASQVAARKSAPPHAAHESAASTVAGFAFYFFGYSTWQGSAVLKLEDLFVRPEKRSLGIGKALMERLAQIALDANCTRFEWQVLDWNTTAKGFYDKLGARVLSAWEPVRIEGPALARLAGRPDGG